MTMGVLILYVEPPLAPDDVTFLPERGERAGGNERAQRLGRGHGVETLVDQRKTVNTWKDRQSYLQARSDHTKAINSQMILSKWPVVISVKFYPGIQAHV
ncbi:hypothetical protein PRIPAC_95512, partial [Pristionchus pacificus]